MGLLLYSLLVEFIGATHSMPQRNKWDIYDGINVQLLSGKVQEVLNIFLPIEQKFADYSLWAKLGLLAFKIKYNSKTEYSCVYVLLMSSSFVSNSL